MAHNAQRNFCEYVKAKHPDHFSNVKVLDVGSLDINGNNRYLFEDSVYQGIDLAPGNNVDIVKPIHEYKPEDMFDTIISTEMLEHDKHYVKSLNRMVELLRSGGLLLLTFATTGRQEHGTNRTRTSDSPFTCDYYKNLTQFDIQDAIDLEKCFSNYRFAINSNPNDLYFWGLKR